MFDDLQIGRQRSGQVNPSGVIGGSSGDGVQMQELTAMLESSSLHAPRLVTGSAEPWSPAMIFIMSII